MLELTLLVLASILPKLELTRPLLGQLFICTKQKHLSVLPAKVDPSNGGVNSKISTWNFSVLYFSARVDPSLYGVDSKTGSHNFQVSDFLAKVDPSNTGVDSRTMLSFFMCQGRLLQWWSRLWNYSFSSISQKYFKFMKIHYKQHLLNAYLIHLNLEQTYYHIFQLWSSYIDKHKIYDF